ncbi:MAG: MFS transporter [Actinomycetota bacterium]|nr:MFS transporter [Actinomycetota bacterium]MDP1876608.1 MFS transporter [Actinomycetota bacterium]
MSHTRALWGSDFYRRLFAARTISNIGNGIMPIALAFGVLALPGATPTSLSIVLAAQAIPLIVMLPIGGVIADRMGRARVIAVTDIVLSGFVATSAALFLTGNATVPLLAILSFCAGVLNGLWWPAMSGLVPEVVTNEDHLQPANAYISVAANGGLVVGSAIGGLLVAAFGSGIAIAIDAASFLIAGLLVFSFRRVSKPHVSGETMLGDLVHGWRVFTSFRWVVVVVLAFSLIVMVLRGAEEVLGPVLAIERYGGAAGWAVVLGSVSAGLLVGALLASRLRVRRPMVFGMLITLVLPAWLVTLAFAMPLPVVAVGAFAWGLSMELFFILWMTALQTHVPREALSRVSAYDAMGSLMFGPIGLALAGPLVAAVGLTTSFLVAAAVATVAILATLLSRSVRELRSHQS